jgi:hypothetical protein
MPTLSPDPDGYWPSCDELPCASIRPLSHADLAGLLTHLQQYDHDQDLNRDQDLDEPRRDDRASAGGSAAGAPHRRPTRRLRPGHLPAPAGRRVGPPGPAPCPGGPPPCWPPAPAPAC